MTEPHVCAIWFATEYYATDMLREVLKFAKGKIGEFCIIPVEPRSMSDPEGGGAIGFVEKDNPNPEFADLLALCHAVVRRHPKAISMMTDEFMTVVKEFKKQESEAT